jgi:purine-cytosine permease-like protein
MEQAMRPGNLFIVFRAMQFIPYIAIGLLVAAIAIWVVFGVKKFKWAKTVAIILTVLVVVTGLLSFSPYILRGARGGKFPGDPQRLRDMQKRVKSSDIGFDYSINNYPVSNMIEIKV